MSEKITSIAITILSIGIIISIIIPGEKQEGCEDDVKQFCESNLMIYEEQNKYTCTQLIIGGYTQRFHFTCQYTKNLTTLILEKTELIKERE